MRSGRRKAPLHGWLALLLALSFGLGAGYADTRPPPAPTAGPSATDPTTAARTAYQRDIRRYGRGDARSAASGLALATQLGLASRFAEAKRVFLEIETIFRSAFKADGLEMARLARDMAIVWERSGDLGDALGYADRAWRLIERQPGAPADVRVDVALQVARLSMQFGRIRDAHQAIASALPHLLDSANPNWDLIRSARQTQYEIALIEGRTSHAEAFLPLLDAAARAAGRTRAAEETLLAQVRIRLREGRWHDALNALAELSRKLPSTGLLRANVLYYLSYIHLVRSQYVEADNLLRQALSLYEAEAGGHHPVVARTLHNLALVYQELGNYSQAEQFYGRALEIMLRNYGRASNEYTKTYLETIRLHNARRDYSRGENVARESIALLGSLPQANHDTLAIAHTALGFALQKQGKNAEAIAAIRQGLALTRASRGEQATELAVPLVNLAELLVAANELDAALAAVDQALAIMQRDGMSTPTTEARALVAKARIETGLRHPREALDLLRDSSALLQRRSQAAGEASLGEAEQRIARPLYAEHVMAAHALSRQPGLNALQLADEAFRAGQAAALSSAARALSQMSTRFSSEASQLGQQVRRRQDLARDLAGLDRLNVELLAVEPALRPAGRQLELARARDDLARQLAKLDMQIGNLFPDYRELSRPEPIPIAAVQQSLAADEALIFQLTLDRQSFIWLISRDQVEIATTNLGTADMAALVRQMRDGVRISPDGTVKPFPVATAHLLYLQTLGALPVSLARFKHLIMVLDGPFQSLPPGLLLTSAPAAADLPYDAHAWLGRSHAISVLPTVGSLFMLRRVTRASGATEPFAGFGNPLFGGTTGQSRSMAALELLRTGGVISRSIFQQVPPLPETAEELERMRGLLNGRQEHVYLAEKATIGHLRRADLSKFRIIGFATHALVAGEFPGLAEPAILLAPGAADDPTDDGLLRASDISRLTLDADWILLSACNTAAPDGGPSADGLSGLAQAFIYAGARTLLVSHWAVSSVATVPLTTGTIEKFSNGGVPKAEALRQSIEYMLRDPANRGFSHPAYWAPFILVGDGWASI